MADIVKGSRWKWELTGRYGRVGSALSGEGTELPWPGVKDRVGVETDVFGCRTGQGLWLSDGGYVRGTTRRRDDDDDDDDNNNKRDLVGLRVFATKGGRRESGGS